MNVDLFKTSWNVDLMRLFKISSNKSWESVGAHQGLRWFNNDLIGFSVDMIGISGISDLDSKMLAI